MRVFKSMYACFQEHTYTAHTPHTHRTHIADKGFLCADDTLLRVCCVCVCVCVYVFRAKYIRARARARALSLSLSLFLSLSLSLSSLARSLLFPSLTPAPAARECASGGTSRQRPGQGRSYAEFGSNINLKGRACR